MIYIELDGYIISVIKIKIMFLTSWQKIATISMSTFLNIVRAFQHCKLNLGGEGF